MKIFKIQITESLSRVIEIEASSIEEAVSKANVLYKNAVVTLDSSDYTEVQIAEHKEVAKDGLSVPKKVKSLN